MPPARPRPWPRHGTAWPRPGRATIPISGSPAMADRSRRNGAEQRLPRRHRRLSGVPNPRRRPPPHGEISIGNLFPLGEHRAWTRSSNRASVSAARHENSSFVSATTREPAGAVRSSTTFQTGGAPLPVRPGENPGGTEPAWVPSKSDLAAARCAQAGPALRDTANMMESKPAMREERRPRADGSIGAAPSCGTLLPWQAPP
jgi:hypothetical protein